MWNVRSGHVTEEEGCIFLSEYLYFISAGYLMGAERLSSEVGFAKTVKQNLIGRKASERAEMPGSIFQMQV